MKVLVIVAHPNLDASNVNRAWVEELRKHDNITVHELYKSYSNGQIDVEKEQALCESHDRIVWQFPFYWYSSPPLMKQWLDSVLTYGWAYGSGGGRLHGKELMMAVSTGSPQEKYQAGGFNHYSMSELLKPFQATSNLIGTTYLPAFVFHGAMGADEAAIQNSVKEYVSYLLK
ncbi:NAD(P)H-dependent oxidoreductase [Paenibacillus popilliae]|uniref:Flavodoxin family protein n=1 Tax=Paenibacillus popilliae TaxID=78057 RepID=A0ABY3AGE2_PAEPP|nr:NAD(P)H-dependent oxidoreductase [Paenibacillus sp. SDF0028]TQR40063.1 flavodoxin family protein [Paenibacillus sp. SDF0028]